MMSTAIAESSIRGAEVVGMPRVVESGTTKFIVVDTSGPSDAQAWRRLPADAFAVTVVLRAHLQWGAGDIEPVVGVGEVVVVRAASLSRLRVAAGGAFCALVFPVELTDVSISRLLPHGASVHRLTSPGGAIARELLRMLAAQLDELGEAASAYVRAALPLADRLLQDASAGEASTPADRQRAAVLGYVAQHLPEPDLSPARIARAHFISVRHLHALFRDHGVTIASLIRRRRLERSYEALIDPAHSNRTISAIAADNGMPNAAQFSRMFRQRFGVAPSRVRSPAGVVPSGPDPRRDPPPAVRSCQ